MKAAKTIFLLMIALGSVGMSCHLYSQSDQQERRLVRTKDLQLSVSRVPTALGQYRYTIECLKDGGTVKRVYEWNQDDPWPVSEIDLSVLNSTTAYFVSGPMVYGVTVDGGDTWIFFDIDKAAQFDPVKRTFYTDVQVNIETSGLGQIYLTRHDDVTRASARIRDN